MPPTSAAYRPRAPERSVLHAVIREHLEPFIREVSDRGDGSGLPRFVEQEFREFLRCGVLAHGFARVRCDTCALERLVLARLTLPLRALDALHLALADADGLRLATADQDLSRSAKSLGIAVTLVRG